MFDFPKEHRRQKCLIDRLGQNRLDLIKMFTLIRSLTGSQNHLYKLSRFGEGKDMKTKIAIKFILL